MPRELHIFQRFYTCRNRRIGVYWRLEEAAFIHVLWGGKGWVVGSNVALPKPEQIDRNFPWLRDEGFRGIPHFISPAWNTDRSKFDPDYYARCWEDIGFKSVTLLTNHHDGYCLYPSKLLGQKPDRDYFGEQVEACRQRGINVLAYYSLSLNSLVGSEHPNWRIRDLQDRVHVPDYGKFSHYHWLCLNSPYGKFALEQLREIVTRYDVVGVWLDILYLPWHPKPSDDATRDVCFCANCHKTYSRMYRGEHLVDAAGTLRHDEFQAATYERFLRRARKMLQKQSRPLLLTFNGAGKARRPFYDRCDALADFCTGEAHNPEALGWFSRQHGNDVRPFELLSCSEICWSHNVLKPTSLLKLEAISTVVHGGTYTIGITANPDGGISKDNVVRLAEVNAWLEKYRPSCRNVEPVFEAALVVDSQRIAVDTVRHADTDYLDRCQRWASILRRSHVLFNLLTTMTDLERYKAIILPAGTPVDQRQIDGLMRYVDAGGNLFIEAPCCDVLAQLAGCQQKGTVPRCSDRPYGYDKDDAHYIRLRDPQLQAGLFTNEPIMIEFNHPVVLDAVDAEVLADLHLQFMPKCRTSDIQTVPNVASTQAHSPAITVRAIGQGCVMLTAMPLGKANSNELRAPWQETLARNCITLLTGQRFVEVPGHRRIEVCVNRCDDAYMVSFLNHNYGPSDCIGDEGPSETYNRLFVALADPLCASCATVSVVPDGGELKLITRKGRRGFVLPSLDVFRMVRVSG